MEPKLLLMQKTNIMNLDDDKRNLIYDGTNRVVG